MTDAPETHKYTNRLIDSTSPYLLQHAHNPVDWCPWSEEALRRAREEDKLILLSIGYSACHWCHVMERESFEDEETAALMNEHFVNVKVDREERPDLDEIYMAATVAMNHGQGGWPMTVFLTPELEPVFAGTYFPPDDRYGRPGFRSVLRQVARAWREDRETLKTQAAGFAEQLRKQRRPRPPLPVGQEELRRALEEYAGAFDPTYGGFGPAPKFPPAVSLRLLLRLHRRFGESHALRMVEVTLDGMARGGMYDHLGGGFARYSTDNRWLVPHFEKMLYDNALLVPAYLEGFQVTGDEYYADIATETLDYVLRDMAAPDGGFYSSTDADSEGEEGKFFVWTPEDIREVLDEDDAELFSAYYDIKPGGNWEGVSIPNTPRPLHAVAQGLGLDADEAAERIQMARVRVFEARERRVKPGLDDKVITAWNGLMIGAFAEGYRILGEERYLRAAEAAADFIFSTLRDDDGRLLRTYRAGQAHLPAHLEDYAYLAEGLLDLYEAGGAPRWLDEATALMERLLDEFADEESGAFYSTSNEHEKLLLRYQDGADGATPAPNAVSASVLARLAHHLNRNDFRDAAVGAISAYGRMIKRFPRGFAKSLCAVDFLSEPPVELALVGVRGSADLEALRRAVAAHYLPNRVQATLDPESDPPAAARLPLLEGKARVDGNAALYLCRDYACQEPVTDPDEAEELIIAREREESESVRVLASPLPGRATSEGTRRYAGRHPEARYRDLGSTGLVTGVLGFGTYRVDDTTPAHREALRLALASGVNLIDTATNYTDGGSERLIGGVLQQLVRGEGLRRDEVIVVSKIGYVQGTNYRVAREREARGEPFPEMLKIEEGLWHCIHPEFLEDQLQRSLERLQLETLDACLLHNPEYFLSEAVRHGERLDDAREEFYSRLQRAFAFFESQIDAGRLSVYGMSSNAVASPASGPDSPSLTRTLESARAAGGDNHGFRLLQMPVNLLESSGALERGAGPDGNSTVLEIAEGEDLAVLANRPLNAFAGGKIFRLADVEVEASTASPDDLLEHLEVLEDEFRATIAIDLQVSEGSLDPTSFFNLAPRLREMRRVIQGIAHWSQLETHVRHTVLGLAAVLDRQLAGEVGARWEDWRQRYLSTLEDVFREIRIEASEATRASIEAVGEVLDPLLPEDRRSESTSRKALWVVASTPGVTCVLTGMRTPEYVEDSLAMMGWSPLEDVEPIYRTLKSIG